jgi:hypothetical protein
MITIPLNEFLSHGGIVDEPLIMLYDEYIKKSAETTAFRDLINFSSRSHPRGIGRPFVFDITVEDREEITGSYFTCYLRDSSINEAN